MIVKTINMSAPKDDLEAVRAVAEAVKDFKPEEQQRIFRWVAEKLGLAQPYAPAPLAPSPPPGAPLGLMPPPSSPSPGGAKDIKTFITEKNPTKDVQFAAAVAYYFRFEAPPAERKEAINKEDLQDAARRAGRPRFSNPLNTLGNAHQLGLLDKGGDKATFVINSVGENLVAMTLPGSSGSTPRSKKKAKKKKAKKKTASKKSQKA